MTIYVRAHNSKVVHTRSDCRHILKIVAAKTIMVSIAAKRKPRGTSWCDECERIEKLARQEVKPNG